MIYNCLQCNVYWVMFGSVGVIVYMIKWTVCWEEAEASQGRAIYEELAIANSRISIN